MLPREPQLTEEYKRVAHFPFPTTIFNKETECEKIKKAEDVVEADGVQLLLYVNKESPLITLVMLPDKYRGPLSPLW